MLAFADMLFIKSSEIFFHIKHLQRCNFSLPDVRNFRSVYLTKPIQIFLQQVVFSFQSDRLKLKCWQKENVSSEKCKVFCLLHNYHLFYIS